MDKKQVRYIKEENGIEKEERSWRKKKIYDNKKKKRTNPPLQDSFLVLVEL